MLEGSIQKGKSGPQSLNSHEITNIIQSVLEKCKREKNWKSESNCFPVNAWFDKECKMERRTLKKTGKEKMNVKLYKQILKRKKDEFMQTRREELICLSKNNPKLFWQELRPRKKQIENYITAQQWFEYAKKLYEK